MDDKVINIAGIGLVKSGVTFFILDNKFMTWDKGLEYLKTKKSLSEDEITQWICNAETEYRDYTIEQMKEKKDESFETWKNRLIAEYQKLTNR